MSKLIDLTGQRFGRWLVIRRAIIEKEREASWVAHCDCGAERLVRGTHLRYAASKSCGCLQRGRATTHGLYGSPVYHAWVKIKSRCLNNHAADYHNYGARGITVCERWLSFETFFQDMGQPPTGKSIERIDNDAGYSPENCRWATPAEQARNRRSNHFLTHEGITLCITDWTRRLGLGDTTIWDRLARGWPVAQTLSQPNEIC